MAISAIMLLEPQDMALDLILERTDGPRSERGPELFLAEARARLTELQESGRIEGYCTYEETLLEAWSLVERRGESGRTVRVTIGQGLPDMRGLEIATCDDPAVMALLTVDPHKLPIETWGIQHLTAAVRMALHARGFVMTVPNAAVMYALWLRIQHGEVMQSEAIPTVELQMDFSGQDFSVTKTPDGREVIVNVFDPALLTRPNAAREVMQHVRQAIASSPAWDYALLEQRFAAEWERAAAGPARLGHDLPVSLLAAHGRTRLKSAEVESGRSHSSWRS